jgi:hypothetical protein
LQELVELLKKRTYEANEEMLRSMTPRLKLDVAYSYACLLLLDDQLEDYRRLCAAHVLPHAKSEDPHEQYLVARTCLLSPKAFDPSAIDLARALYQADQPPPYVVHTYALSLYRSGKAQEAASLIDELQVNAPKWAPQLNASLLILARYRAGDVEGARQLAFAKASVVGLEHPHDILAKRVLDREMMLLRLRIARPRK